MGKTSYRGMTELSKKLHGKLTEFKEGKLRIADLEELTRDAQELYERLVILKFKAYETFGKSSNEGGPIDTIEENEEDSPALSTVEEESSVEIEQPSFDFSASEETVERNFPESAAIKSKLLKEEDSEIFPESMNIKSDASSSIFIESHVEHHEPEDEDSLNQQLGEEEELSLRRKLQNSPVEDLKSEISIAKKFEYITFMFEGKNERYEEAIEALNNCSDGEEARNKLNAYSTQYNWDLENKSIIKFVELVERRYL